MSRTQLLLLLFLAFFVTPIDGAAQVNLRRYPVQRGDGETLEMDRTEMYQSGERYRRAIEQDRGDRDRQKYLEREAAYAADACGFGCEGHEGLQVRGIPGTDLAAVVYKARLDDEVLTVQLRFHNDGAEPARLTIDPTAQPEAFYVRIGGERLRIRSGGDGRPVAKDALDEVLHPGGIESWWATFSVPRDAFTFDLHLPGVTFRDVPLETD